MSAEENIKNENSEEIVINVSELELQPNINVPENEALINTTNVEEQNKTEHKEIENEAEEKDKNNEEKNKEQQKEYKDEDNQEKQQVENTISAEKIDENTVEVVIDPMIPQNKLSMERKSIRYSAIIADSALVAKEHEAIKSVLFDVTITENPDSFTSPHFDQPFNLEDKELWFKSYDSFYVQENPDGDEILNNLFEKSKTNKSEDRSLFSLLENILDKESDQISDPGINRSILMQNIIAANDERKGLLTQNQMYQSKLIEYFRKVKVKQIPGTKQSSEKESLMDFNTQYSRYGEILHQLIKELSVAGSKYDEKIKKMKSICENKSEQVEKSTNNFVKYQEGVGLASVHSRTGNKLDPNIIHDYLQLEMKKEIAIKNERLQNLRIEHKNSNLDLSLRSKEHFEGGLRLIDFEQLKIENQTFNEKVEDREESINKLNKKITRCNHLLSHVKEKISVTDHDKKTSRIVSKKLNREFKQLQKNNNKAKKHRDHIKLNNKNLQMSCGLLGKKDYLRRYEEVEEDTENLRNKIIKMEIEKNYIQSTNNKLIREINDTNNKKK